MEKLRYLNKKINHQERKNFSNWWYEQINIYGQEIEYYTNQTSLSSAYQFYGENIDVGFGQPNKMVVLLNLNNDSYLLSKFGIIADSDMTGVIHPKGFTKYYGLSSEPKPGDLMVLSEFGSDRLNYPKRGATVYEITEIKDEFEYNPIAGHYVWFFKARRYDYSYETGGPGSGQGNTPVDDNDSTEEAAKINFDYLEDNPCSNTSVYGEY
jgi:hypothetical protein